MRRQGSAFRVESERAGRDIVLPGGLRNMPQDVSGVSEGEVTMMGEGRCQRHSNEYRWQE